MWYMYHPPLTEVGVFLQENDKSPTVRSCTILGNGFRSLSWLTEEFKECIKYVPNEVI
ncbi:MAG TPA: hypothetical protein PKI14_06670 [Fervidobacterium sp.]|nr:hypothetical protein [Fervidobacterium sp.]HPT53773.1 hypothetical protein [Fervidobacterium sp.]HPZ17565.1 hypothetical protein [Fervidobacterium sp.]HQE48820.1 hypothetical protein [Fervidobacterium sp.]HUM42612.1 hypothetical protein [Fervidobacterium sp.]